jgi:hypothetical protein
LAAVVHAPVSGKQSADQFHAYLFGNTKKTLAKFSAVVGRRATPCNTTLHFSYTFSVENGQVLVIDGVMRFQIDEKLKKIKRLSTIYNLVEMRAFMAEAGIAPPPAAELPRQHQASV